MAATDQGFRLNEALLAIWHEAEFIKFKFDSYILENPSSQFVLTTESGLVLTYHGLGELRFGNLGKHVGLSELEYSKLDSCFPPYAYYQTRLSSKNGTYLRSDFQFRLECFNRVGQQIRLTHEIGHFFQDESGGKHLLPPTLADLMLGYQEHQRVRTETKYLTNQNFRKRHFATLRSLAKAANSSLEKAIEQENLIFLGRMPYTIGRTPSGDIVLSASAPDGLENADLEFQKILATFSGGVAEPTINLGSQDRGVRNRVILAPEAVEDLRLIRDYNTRGQEFLAKLVENPGVYFPDHLPKEMIGDLFGDSVAGFEFGHIKANRDSEKSNADWAFGFEGGSALLRATNGVTIPIAYSPTPVQYSSLKRSYNQLKEQIEDYEDALRESTGLVFTPLPPTIEKKIQVPELGLEFSLSELHHCCKQIERANKPIIESVSVATAKEILREASVADKYTINWIDPLDESTREIPTQSLKLALSKSGEPKEKKKVPIAVVQANESERLGTPPPWTPQAPEGLNLTPLFRSDRSLHEHQIFGALWLRWLLEHDTSKNEFGGKKGALIADDMGLGKTVQILSLVGQVKTISELRELPILIVAPLSLLESSWKADGFQYFFRPEVLGPGRDLHLVHPADCPIDLDKERFYSELQLATDQMTRENIPLHECELSTEIKGQIKQIQKWSKNKVLLASYETVRLNHLWLATIDFSLVILDEAQKIKNIGVRQSQAVKSLKSEMRIAMTGTPIENTLADLFGIMDFVLPGYLGTFKEFRHEYIVAARNFKPGTFERDKLRKTLESALKPIWLRRTKKEIYGGTDVLKPITYYDSVSDESGNTVNKHIVQMSKSQIEIYEKYMNDYINAEGGGRLVILQKLLEVCSAPWLLTGDLITWAQHASLFALCPKLKSTIEILETIRKNAPQDGQKVIVFANIIEIQRSLAFFIADWHKKTTGVKIEVEVYNGQAPAQSRVRTLERFKNSSGFQVLIISPRSGGAGLNIVEANHVIHYTREWNPALEMQATARSYRLKQTRPVHVYFPTSSMAEVDKASAEEHLANILSNKRNIVDDFTISLSDMNLAADDFENISDGFPKTDGPVAFDCLDGLGPEKFELLVACLYERAGYKTKYVGGPGDRGADVLCFGQKNNLLIQVKHTEAGHAQHTAAINEARGAKSYYEKKEGVLFKLVAVTNGRFSQNAESLSLQGDPVELVDYSRLREIMRSETVLYSHLKLKRKAAA